MKGDRTSDYDFTLPADRIAQAPAARRDGSRLMVVHRNSGAIEHRQFAELTALVDPGDVVVLNTTRVFRARLLGRRDSGAPAEIFLLRRHDDGRWEAMVQPGGKLKPGRTVHIAPGFDVRVEEVTTRRTRLVRLLVPEGDEPALIERHGHVPLPPYIERADAAADMERYQTVYARQSGSVAAPTAGLHFTPELLSALEARGVQRAEVLLHVGAGTFKPVDAESLADHVMHEEWYDVPVATAELLNRARAAGRQVWCVGTTSLRTLESVVDAERRFHAGTGETRIFIHPPRRVLSADRLVTNFHLPRSTLLMLVAAFAGYDLAMHAYRVAIDEGYRFYSYGDAMVVI
ncbi:MAG: tRNA preQ1(34) S-adenosylmethionine ribosyltransferase-isomerase QueA [Gemmatimonadota bacterium]|nr:tRNA preQ1(34) S-adenosylmethionine ribosyltransferase-isomerase QueA [Gemmatimonadota bacterium]